MRRVLETGLLRMNEVLLDNQLQGRWPRYLFHEEGPSSPPKVTFGDLKATNSQPKMALSL